jgi:hypothetical protein
MWAFVCCPVVFKNLSSTGIHKEMSIVLVAEGVARDHRGSMPMSEFYALDARIERIQRIK